LKTINESIAAIEKSGAYKQNSALADSLAELYLQRCTYRASIKDCDRAIEIYERYVKDSEGKRAKALMVKGSLQKSNEDYKAASETYREAIRSIGKSTDWERGRMISLSTNLDLLLEAVGNYYLTTGLMALNEGKYWEAINDLTSAIKYLKKVQDYDFDLAKAYHGRGVAYCRSGKLDEAIADFQKAAELLNDLVKKEPTNEAVAYELGMTLYHLGNALVKKGEYEKAADYYEKASLAFMGVPAWEKSAKLVLSVGRAYVKKAEALHRQKKYAEATKYYEKGIKHLKRAGRLCRKDRKYCPTKGELKAAGKHLNQAKRKKEFKE